MPSTNSITRKGCPVAVSPESRTDTTHGEESWVNQSESVLTTTWRAVELQVGGEKHDTHAAAVELTHELVAALQDRGIERQGLVKFGGGTTAVGP